MTNQSDFKNIPLKEIKADPNQPRKFFDQLAMDELTTSIKEKGVLQPILVRPNGKGFILVCGERRFKASALAGLPDIPAMIRTIDDNEALELQIVENLQRKDVHPMEEAVAFKSLLDHKQFSIQEIAARIGKKDFYVKQRLKLNELIKDWQDAFFKNTIHLTDVLKVAMLDHKQQEQLFEEEGGQKKIELDNWTLRKYQGDLSKASFELSDPQLNKKAGPCTSCKFNSAVALLFPEHASSPRCMNVACFTTKTETHFTNALKLAKEDPAIIFLEDNYNHNTSDKLLKAVKAEGFEIMTSEQFREIQAPEKPDWEGFKEDNEDDFDTEDEMKKDFNDQLNEYDDDLKAYQAKTSSGKYKKAFMLTGNDKGKYIFIELRKGSGSSAKAAAPKGKDDIESMNAGDIDAEITRINEREKRAKELDQQKIWSELLKHFNPSANASLLKDEFTQTEREAVAMALYGKLDYSEKDNFRSTFKPFFKTEKYKTDPNFSGIDATVLRQMTRFFFLDTLPPVVLYNGFNDGALVCIKVAGQYFPSVLNEIMEKQNEISAKRGERVKTKIKSFTDQKKALKVKTPAAKKTAKKKS